MGVFLGASSGWSGSSGRPSSRSAWKETRGRELLLNGFVSKPEEEDQNDVLLVTFICTFAIVILVIIRDSRNLLVRSMTNTLTLSERFIKAGSVD